MSGNWNDKNMKNAVFDREMYKKIKLRKTWNQYISNMAELDCD